MTEPSRQSGSDPIGDLQRWLVRSGARSVTRQMRGQIRTALGGGKQQSTANVWETATSEADEAPECAWCPICRARRRLRDSGPGLSSGVSAAADAVGAVMQDAMSAFEAAVAAAGRPARPQDTTAPQAGEVWDEATDEPAVRSRPSANGGPTRQTGPRPSPAAPKQPSAGAKNRRLGPSSPQPGPSSRRPARRSRPRAPRSQPPGPTGPPRPTAPHRMRPPPRTRTSPPAKPRLPPVQPFTRGWGWLTRGRGRFNRSPAAGAGSPAAAVGSTASMNHRCAPVRIDGSSTRCPWPAGGRERNISVVESQDQRVERGRCGWCE